jgi:hypothetical protein
MTTLNRYQRPDFSSKNKSVLADMGKLGKILISAARTKIAKSETYGAPLGAYLHGHGEVSIVRSECEDSNVASQKILVILRDCARNGSLRAAAICHILRRPILNSMETLIQLHIEHAIGKVFDAAVPADKSILLAGVSAVEGCLGREFGSRRQLKVFLLETQLLRRERFGRP